MAKKTVLITGAGSGFGRGAAIELARRGHKVIAGVLNETQAADLAKAEPKLAVVQLDITDPNDVAKVDAWDPDVFVANAAIGQTGPLSLIPLERLRAVFEVNVFATFAVTQRVARIMRRKRAAPEDVAVMDQLVQRITVGQMDPAEVVKRYVELVEAEATELVNFVPPDIVERMSKSMPAR
jgi:NAD(P)-dependent dehydrogenase (short-subunit alcohol dehydrogenase family)